MSTTLSVIPSSSCISLETSRSKELTASLHRLKNLVYNTPGLESFRLDSREDIIRLMHYLKGENTGLKYFDREMIWNNFNLYEKAYQNYHLTACGYSLEDTQEALRKIDPRLVGEKRYLEGDSTLAKGIKSIYYAIVRMTSDPKQVKALAFRAEHLKGEKKKASDTQKVIDLFPKFFQTTSKPQTVEEVDRFLGAIKGNPTLDKRKQWFECYLKANVNPCLDALFNRQLSPPKKEKVALKTLDKEAARHLVDVMIRASLNETDGRELSNIVKTKLLPVDMIEAVRVYPDLTDTYDIVFKAPISGSTSVVDGKGWKDMTHSKMELERIVTVEFDPSNSRILFPSGGFKLGVHLEDTEFLYRKVSCGERLAISTFLKAYGYMSIMGSMTSPLQYSATVRSIENLDDTDLKLGFNIDDKCSVSFPKKGVEATRSCLSALQGAVDGVDLTKNELIDTFEHFTWKERSQ